MQHNKLKSLTNLIAATILVPGLLIGQITMGWAGCEEIPRYEVYVGPENCPDASCTRDVWFPAIWCAPSYWPLGCFKNDLITGYTWSVYSAECEGVSEGGQTRWVCGDEELVSQNFYYSGSGTMWPGICFGG